MAARRVGGSSADRGAIGDGQDLDRRQRVARQGYQPMPREQRDEAILATARRMIEPMDDGRGLVAECDCYVTTGGANFCSSGAGSCMVCTTDTQCVKELAIPGSACVTVNHGPVCGTNCNGFQTACYGPCTA